MSHALLLIAATQSLAQASGLDLAYVTSFGDGTWARPTHAVLVVEEGLEVLLVVDNANGRVLKLRSGDGKVVGSFGEGDGAESVHAPTCLATDGKVLAVADTERHQVVVYDLATGRFLRAVGSADVLSSPISVAIRKAAGGGQPDELWVVEFKGHEARDPPDRRSPVPCHKTPVHNSPTLLSLLATRHRSACSTFRPARCCARSAAASGARASRQRRRGRRPAPAFSPTPRPQLPPRLHVARTCSPHLARTAPGASPAPRTHSGA